MNTDLKEYFENGKEGGWRRGKWRNMWKIGVVSKQKLKKEWGGSACYGWWGQSKIPPWVWSSRVRPPRADAISIHFPAQWKEWGKRKNRLSYYNYRRDDDDDNNNHPNWTNVGPTSPSSLLFLTLNNLTVLHYPANQCPTTFFFSLLNNNNKTHQISNFFFFFLLFFFFKYIPF